MVRHKNTILWELSATAIIQLKWKVSFVWYQAAMILKPWYGAYLLICDLLREKGPTAIKPRFKTQLDAFSL